MKIRYILLNETWHTNDISDDEILNPELRFIEKIGHNAAVLGSLIAKKGASSP